MVSTPDSQAAILIPKSKFNNKEFLEKELEKIRKR
jgi:hypothetical protein